MLAVLPSMMFDLHPLLLALALAVEAAFGYPQALIPRIGHPVIWLGGLIARFDRRFNRPTMPNGLRRLNGIAALLLLLAAAIVPTALAQAALFYLLPPILALLVLALAASTLLAQRSLDSHVLAVAEALERGGLDAGRNAVGMIVGRNVKVLDEAGVARAAIESLAENFSDGITAPAFWCVVGGLPGIAAYKAVNTADSMIGHKTERHLHFGWAAARFDDLVNLPASRLTALFLVLAAAGLPGASPRAALRAIRRDAGQHKSPNAGWPEAAMAGALGLRLNGPKLYGETVSTDAWMGDGRAEAGPADIRRALALYRRALAIQGLLVAVIAVFLWISG